MSSGMDDAYGHEDHTASSSMNRPDVSPTNSRPSKRTLDISGSHQSNKRTKHTSSVHSSLTPPSSPSSSTYPSTISITRMHQALRVLRKLAFFLKYPYPHESVQGSCYTGSFDGQAAEDLKLLKKVASNLDGFLPFPRRAPSVLHAMSPSGLTGRVLDPSLLFSAISFRAVFFKSPYHFDHPTFLQDFEEYKSRVQSRPQHPSPVITPGATTDSYWANPNQYSSGPHKPLVEHISTYWSSVNLKWCYPPHKVFKGYNSNNPPPSVPPSPIPFQPFMRDYLCFNRKSKATGDRINLFPNLGGLIGYLCALDLSYAGYVEKPSIDDIVDAMVNVNSGGIRGLIALGLVEKNDGKKKYPANEIQKAFTVLHTFLDTHLTDEEKEKMVFDRPMSEHFSCKLSKLVGLKLVVFRDQEPFDSCTCCS